MTETAPNPQICCDQPAHFSKACLIVLFLTPLIFISFGVYIYCILPSQPNILQGDGYLVQVDTTVSVVNRYLITPDGTIPLSAAGPIDRWYFQRFENGSSDLNTTNLQFINNNRRWVYEGNRSLVFFGTSAGNGGGVYKRFTNATFTINDTTDLIFYTFIERNIGPSGGYYYFQVNTTFTDDFSVNHNYTFTYLLLNTTTNGYTTTNPNEYVYKVANPNVGIYTGYVIKSIRQFLETIDAGAYDVSFNITSVFWNLKGTVLNRAFLDYLDFQRIPYNPTNIWYNATNAPKTDYIITINYTVYADSSAIANLSEIQIIVNIFRNLTSELGDWGRVLDENFILENLTFTSTIFGLYNNVATGTKSGIMHSFPINAVLGYNLTYAFDVDMQGYAKKIDGMPTNAGKNFTIPSAGFTVYYKSPLFLA